MNLILIIVFITAVFGNAIANVFLKMSSITTKNETVTTTKSLLNPYFLLGIISFGIALFGYRYILNKGIKVSLAYPIFTTAGYSLVLISSIFLFNEKLNLNQWIGVSFIFVGVWVIAFS